MPRLTVKATVIGGTKSFHHDFHIRRNRPTPGGGVIRWHGTENHTFEHRPCDAADGCKQCASHGQSHAAEPAEPLDHTADVPGKVIHPVGIGLAGGGFRIPGAGRFLRFLLGKQPVGSYAKGLGQRRNLCDFGIGLASFP